MKIQTDFQKAVYNCGDKFSENYTSQSRKQLDDILTWYNIVVTG